MSTLAQIGAFRRPGGRTADITARIRAAVLDLLVEGGPAHCTYKSVAERAGVERSTLYRRFPDAWDMMIDAFIARAATDVMPDLGDNFAEDLASVLRRLAEILQSPLGPALIAVAAGLRGRSGSDYSRAYFDQRMSQLAPMFDAAVARGELPADTDREGLFTFAAGAVYFRLFIAGRGIDDAFIASIVESICWLHCTAEARPKVSLPVRIA